MKTLFSKLLMSFILIIVLIIISVLASFYLFYARSYDEQIIAENSRQALYVARSLHLFINAAYREVEELSFNSDVISLDTNRQTPVFVSAIERNEHFELLYAQGMDGMQTGRSSGNLGNRKERWWFEKMEQVKTPFVSQSYYSVGTNMPCASVFFPIMRDSRMIGIMAGDIKLSALHDLVVEIADEGSLSFILDGNGVVAAHPDKTFQEELYNYVNLTRSVTLKDANGNPLQNAAGNLTEEKPFAISDAYRAAIADMMRGNINSAKFMEEGRTIYLSYRPVPMEGASDPWYVLSVKEESAAMHRRNTVILAILISSAFIIAISFVIVYFIAKNISSPIKIIHTVLEKAKEGDLTAIGEVLNRRNNKNPIGLESFSHDEFGDLMTALANFLNKLSADFFTFNQNASMVTNAVFELSSSTREITATANEQSASVAEIVSTMENNKNLSSQAAAKTVEVAELADKTRELSRRGSDLRDANEGMMLEIRNQNAKITDVIRNLADMLSGIDESIQLIDTIADHTKLIAFNAALEASSSGEAGSRFAVVAGEIRRFADNVVESASEIKEKISELQEASQTLITEADNGSRAIDSGYNRMVEQKEVFENIVDTSQNVAIRSQQITNLSKQQELASSQVFIALKEISSGVNQFVTATTMTSETVNKLNSMSVELKETLAKYQTKKGGNA
jgi:methyl-accepting chemotaxis protein